MLMRKRSSSCCLRDRKSFPAAHFLLQGGEEGGSGRRPFVAKSFSLEHLPATQLVNQLVLINVFHEPSGFVGLMNFNELPTSTNISFLVDPFSSRP